MPHPHIAALAMSVVRRPCTRSSGCRRMPQLGARVTAGPRRMKASLVWICSVLASIQKSRSAHPTSSTGTGLLARLELVTALERAERTFLAMSNLLLWWNTRVVNGIDESACQHSQETPQLHAQVGHVIPAQGCVPREEQRVVGGLPQAASAERKNGRLSSTCP